MSRQTHYAYAVILTLRQLQKCLKQQEQDGWTNTGNHFLTQGYKKMARTHVALVKGGHVCILKLPQCQNFTGPTCISIMCVPTHVYALEIDSLR